MVLAAERLALNGIHRHADCRGCHEVIHISQPVITAGRKSIDGELQISSISSHLTGGCYCHVMDSSERWRINQVLSINAAVRQLRKEENSLYNCICSILTDAQFVEEVVLTLSLRPSPPPFFTPDGRRARGVPEPCPRVCQLLNLQCRRYFRRDRPCQRMQTCVAGCGMSPAM